MKENKASDFAMPAAAIFAVLLAVVPITGVSAVECYLCSWSNRDLWNMTGLCYPGNFSTDYGIRMDCEAGCEMSFLYNKDGVPTHFYRNCAPANRPITDTWRTLHDDYGHKRMYTCNWHLCNNGSRLSTSFIYALVLPFFTLLFSDVVNSVINVATSLWYHSSRCSG